MRGLTVVGIDTGGTFTDLVVEREGKLLVHKEPSTPANPAEAVIRGLRALLGDVPVDIVHGSTVATNATLERRGARTALLITEGFEDVLRIGRQTRPSLYDLDVQRQPPLVPRDMTVGVAERLGPAAEILVPLDAAGLPALAERVAALQPQAVAICLLHSYEDPRHEIAVAEAVRPLGVFVCTSHDVLPEFREYERCSTTVLNAYVGPVMQGYLEDVERRSGARRVRVMQSNGGAMSVGDAGRHAVHTILSGPAGGVVGAMAAARAAGTPNAITFDMGGTSTDVSLCPGKLTTTSESTIAGLPVRVPVIDIHTVGAGGGSIAYRDPGGGLRVGPRSAGADPGPVCYGRGGDQVTVTDANLVLGRLDPHRFLGGATRLDADAAHDAVLRLARKFDMHPLALAEGITKVADATMEAAIRVISVERGHDPADFTLVCFGGAGGMHAAALAASLSIPRVLVPPAPGALSAWGMLRAEPQRDYSRSFLRPAAAVTDVELDTLFEELTFRARDDELLADAEDELRLERAVDLRYRGQGYELTVPYSSDFARAFHAAHERRYGYSDPSRELEVVTLRLRARATRMQAAGAPAKEPHPSAAEAHDFCIMVFDGVPHDAGVFERHRLEPGARFRGPALVVEYSATTVLPPDWHARVDALGNLLLERGDGS